MIFSCQKDLVRWMAVLGTVLVFSSMFTVGGLLRHCAHLCCIGAFILTRCVRRGEIDDIRCVVVVRVVDVIIEAFSVSDGRPGLSCAGNGWPPWQFMTRIELDGLSSYGEKTTERYTCKLH